MSLERYTPPPVPDGINPDVRRYLEDELNRIAELINSLLTSPQLTEIGLGSDTYGWDIAPATTFSELDIFARETGDYLALNAVDFTTYSDLQLTLAGTNGSYSSPPVQGDTVDNLNLAMTGNGTAIGNIGFDQGNGDMSVKNWVRGATIRLTARNDAGGDRHVIIDAGALTVDFNQYSLLNDNGDVPVSDGTTGGTGSAGSGNQYVELNIGGTTYKVLHDGTV